MSVLQRVLAAAVAVELLAGIVAIGTRNRWDDHLRGRGPASPDLAAGAGSGATTVLTLPTSTLATSDRRATPGPGTSYLSANLIDPTDMGGYYQVSTKAASTFLGSAPCLASLQPGHSQDGHSQDGHAAEVLYGPDLYSVPEMVEVVSSYPSSSATAAYRDVAGSIGGCRPLSFDFGGSRVGATLTAGSIPPVGNADRVWSGRFTYQGRSMSVQLGVVLAGQTVISIVWIDTVPGSDPIMGNFVSTISVAIGKLA